jgi:ParB/RepB/Spo0J family partition protein
MTEMIIEQLDIQDIKPYPNNPRKNAKAIDKVADSITQYGFQQPIVVDKDLVIVVGHTRYQAAKKLLLAQVPVLIANNLDSDQANGYRIMDNKSGEWADWDERMLYDELNDLIQENNIQELSYETGFSESELNKLFAPESDPIEEYNETESYKSKLGDIWTLGNHRILNGDSNSVQNVNELLQDEQIDCIWTDPPYGISYQSVNKINSGIDSHQIQNDDLSAEQLDQFLVEHLSNIDHKVKPGAPIYWCHDIKYSNINRNVLEQNKYHISDTLIWHKNAHSTFLSDYAKYYEPIHYGWKEGGNHPWYGDGWHPNVYTSEELEALTKEQLIKVIKNAPKNIQQFSKESRSLSSLHPTIKPVKLIIYHLLNSTKQSDIVYDGFAGSGSTIIACERSNRKARCIELEPKFIDVIVNRWQEETGLQASRQDGTLWDDVIGQEVDDLLDSAYEDALNG